VAEGGNAVWVRRGLVAAGALAVAWFAVQGGEYGTNDLLRQRAEKRSLERKLRALQREVDSLDAYRSLVLSDRATQERIAREEFGMVRGDKEMLYRFAPAGESAKDP
jgi:cell division protein FtsB